MRPQVHISLIGAACALVVLAFGALAPLLDTPALADVAISTAAPTFIASTPIVTAVADVMMPTQIVMPTPMRPTPIADIVSFDAPQIPSSAPATSVPSKPAVVREALILAPTVMSQPTAEPTAEPTAAIDLSSSLSPTPTSKPRANRPRPASQSTPTPAAEPTAEPTEAATPIATADSPRRGPQAETPTEVAQPIATPTPPAEMPTEVVEPTTPPEPPQLRETMVPTTLPQSPVEPPLPTEAPIGGLVVDLT
jgi:hypothetical protein